MTSSSVTIQIIPESAPFLDVLSATKYITKHQSGSVPKCWDEPQNCLFGNLDRVLLWCLSSLNRYKNFNDQSGNREKM
jgi:hypothetical protein